MNQLTNDEKNLLQEILDEYRNLLTEKSERAGDFIAWAHETGDVASSGEKYEQNKILWEIKDNIRKMIAEKKIAAGKLISKLMS